MGVWDYVSVVITPFFQNPVFILIIALLLVGGDAYAAMFGNLGTASNESFSGNSFAYDCTHTANLDSLDRAILATPGLKDLHACSAITSQNNGGPLGIFGGVLTGMLHFAGLPQEVSFSSAEMFFVMLFLSVFTWAGTALAK